jgi:hypothetical protein
MRRWKSSRLIGSASHVHVSLISILSSLVKFVSFGARFPPSECSPCRYVRQLAQEQREKEVLYKIRNVKVPPVDRMQKPLPAFAALERCLAKPQYVPSVRCSKLLGELGDQIKVRCGRGCSVIANRFRR